MHRFKEYIAGSAVALALLLVPSAAVAAAPPWESAPVVPRLSVPVKAKLLETVAIGQRKGMRARVFAKAGDSNTEMSANLYGLGCRPAPPELTPALAGVLRRFNSVKLANPSGFPDCRRSTSFSRRSAATKSATWSSWSATEIADLGDDYWRPPDYCTEAETPLVCELRIIRPRFVFILAGTNDIGMDSSFGLSPGAHAAERLRPLITQARSRGVVPVLSTIPPVHPSDPERAELFEEGVRRTNSKIFRLASESKVPLINLWRAMSGPEMINQGLSGDGLHLGVFGAGETTPSLDPDPSIFSLSTDFSTEALRYGANRRNLIFLKTLAVLDRAIR